DRRALRDDSGTVHRLETVPTDDQGAVEAPAVGFVKHVLNGCERRARVCRGGQPHCCKNRTGNHNPPRTVYPAVREESAGKIRAKSSKLLSGQAVTSNQNNCESL